MSDVEGTNTDAIASVMVHISNLGIGCLCFPFHLGMAKVVFLSVDDVKTGGVTVLKQCIFEECFLTNPSSRASTDSSLLLDNTDTGSDLTALGFRASL